MTNAGHLLKIVRPRQLDCKRRGSEEFSLRIDPNRPTCPAAERVVQQKIQRPDIWQLESLNP